MGLKGLTSAKSILSGEKTIVIITFLCKELNTVTQPVKKSILSGERAIVVNFALGNELNTVS